MSSPAPQLYLGVDGGGSKTMAWIGRISNAAPMEIIGRGRAGAGNPHTVGFETAMLNIERAIVEAFAESQLRKLPVAAACFCLAGVARVEERKRVTKWLETQDVASKFCVASDAEAIIAARPHARAQRSSNQVALIAGTGSIAWGFSVDGRVVRCGGWGYVLDDLGSGYWLGKSVLHLACRAADGRCNEPEILDATLKATACSKPEQLIEWTYSSAMARSRISRLAQVVFDLADEHIVAADLVDRGAQHLAELAGVVMRKLETQQFSLALAGGVLSMQPKYVDKVLHYLQQAGFAPSEHWVVRDPVHGALNLAVALLRNENSASQ